MSNFRIVPRSGKGIRIDQVWIWGILGILAFVISPFSISPNDFWWHLKVGQLIFNTHSIPTTNMFGWTLPINEPFIYGEWLGELLFYWLYRINGIYLIIFARNLLAIAAFGLVGYEAYRRSKSWRLAGIVIVLAVSMASNNLGVRPQIWAWVPFIVMFIVLGAFTNNQLKSYWLLVCPLLMAFWVNSHGSYILAIILVVTFFIGELVRKLIKFEGALDTRGITWLGANAGLTVLATLVNPRFVGSLTYVVNMMTDRPSQKLVVEWQPPTPNSYATIVFFASILLLLVVFAYARYRPTPTELLLILGFTWLAWSGVRYIIWYSMIVMPILAGAAGKLLVDKPWMALPRRNMVNLILVAVLWLPSIFVQPWFIDHIPMPKSFWGAVLRDNQEGPLLSTGTPVAAADYLRQHPGGKLYNEMGYGSYLIWALPGQQVFCDTRVELYPYDFWLDYIKINNGLRYNELLSKYGADRLLLDKKEQEGLISFLKDDPAWRLEYEDDYSQIWTKTNR